MPSDPSSALDSSLAPAQIYIVLAITVASFSWLLKSETLGELTGRQVLVGGLLILYQLLHVATYAAIHEIRPEINFLFSRQSTLNRGFLRSFALISWTTVSL